VGVFAAFSMYALLGLAVTAFYELAVPDLQGRSLDDNERAADSVTRECEVTTTERPHGASDGRCCMD